MDGSEDGRNPRGPGEGPDPAAAGATPPGPDHTAAGEAEAGPAPEEPGRGPATPMAGGRRLAGRGLRWGTATATYVAVVVAILVAVNLVASHIPTSFDLTAHHRLTLTTATKNILKSLKQRVQITAFEQPGDPTGEKVKVLLAEYRADSHGLISYQVVDPVADRALAVRDHVTSYGTMIITSGKNTQTLQATDLTTYSSTGTPQFAGESAITNAIIRAASPVQFTVDFLTGDGEPSIAPGGGFSSAVSAIKSQGYTVGSLNLFHSNGVPANVSTLVIADPAHDLTTAEIAALKAYAARGGHLLFLLDPTLTPLPNLHGLLRTWGVTPQNDLAIDNVRHYQTDPTAIAPLYGSSPITQPIQAANLATLLIGAQGLTIAPPKGYTLTPMLTTSPGVSATGQNSYGITNLKGLSSSSGLGFTKGDIAGPLTLAASISQNLASTASAGGAAGGAASLGQKQFRAVVVGNAAFIASSSTGQATGPIDFQGNRDLLLNTVGWLTGRAEGITVRPRPSLNTQVFLTAQSTHALILTFVVGVPLVCFILGFGTWWSRRRL